jgi:hypothetical protein
MRLGTVAWGLALLLVANLPSAGLSAERETAATPKQEAGRVIPANVERAALEGTIEEVDRKAGTFVMNEQIVQWDASTQFLDARGAPTKASVPENGMRALVAAAEIVGGYFALTIQEIAR